MNSGAFSNITIVTFCRVFQILCIVITIPRSDICVLLSGTCANPPRTRIKELRCYPTIFELRIPSHIHIDVR